MACEVTRGVIGGAPYPGQEFVVLTRRKTGLERRGLGVEGEVSRLAFLVYDSIMYCQASTELTCHTHSPSRWPSSPCSLFNVGRSSLNRLEALLGQGLRLLVSSPGPWTSPWYCACLAHNRNSVNSGWMDGHAASLSLYFPLLNGGNSANLPGRF